MTLTAIASDLAIYLTLLSDTLLRKKACNLAAEGLHNISEAVSMTCSQAFDRLSCSSKAISAVRFTGDRTCANRETPENEEASETRQGLELRHRRTSKQSHSKENNDNCLEGLLMDLTAVTIECCCGALLTFRQVICHQSTWLQRQCIIIWCDDAKHQAVRTGHGATAVRLWRP